MPAFFVEQRFRYWVKFDLHAWGNNKRNLLWNEMGCNHIERIEIVPWVKRGQGYCLVNGLLKKKKQCYPKYKTHQSLRNDMCITCSQRWCTLSVQHRTTGREAHQDRKIKPSCPSLCIMPQLLLTQTMQRVESTSRMGPFSPQHTGFVQQGLAAAPLARSLPQLLLGSAQARKGMISITGGTAAAPEDMDEANPSSKSYLNWAKSWPAGPRHSCAVLLKLRTLTRSGAASHTCTDLSRDWCPPHPPSVSTGIISSKNIVLRVQDASCNFKAVQHPVSHCHKHCSP